MILNLIMKNILKRRIGHIERFMKNPHEIQEQLFFDLIQKGKNTEWGKKYGYNSIKSAEAFKNTIPVSPYESLFPYIDRMMQGEQNILWPTKISWFSKSSGTTN